MLLQSAMVRLVLLQLIQNTQPLTGSITTIRLSQAHALQSAVPRLVHSIINSKARMITICNSHSQAHTKVYSRRSLINQKEGSGHESQPITALRNAHVNYYQWVHHISAAYPLKRIECGSESQALAVSNLFDSFCISVVGGVYIV